MPFGYIQNEVIYSTTPPTPVHGLGQLWQDISVTPAVLYQAVNLSPLVYAPLFSGGGAAPDDATYLTLSLNGTLTNERVLTAGSFIAFTDTGPAGTLTIDLMDHAVSHAAGGGDEVNHNTLLNYVANEHIDHSGVSITGANGLTGGGAITVSQIIQPGYAGAILGLANANSNGVANEIARSDHQHKRDVRVASAGVDVGTRNRINFIAGTNISLIIADDAGNDEIDVTINASGGGGSADIQTATIAAPYDSYDYSEIIVDAAVTAASQIMLGWGATSVDDENTPDMEDINFAAVADPAGGQFTAYIASVNNNPFGGPFKLNYLLG